MTSFGGDWTREKLDRVSAYLSAFQNVLKHQQFNLVYIDAFSGDDSVELRKDELPLFEQGRSFTEGSARRAITLHQPFDRYHFIDSAGSSLDKLKVFVDTDYPALADRMNYQCGDVNDELPRAIAGLNARTERAVVFADPYGMQLDWKTIETIGSKPVDFWYLAPTMAINRVLTRDGKLPESCVWPRALKRWAWKSTQARPARAAVATFGPVR
jgi:three-Cys-motif partner protein